jgi:hypothetical protein
MKKWNVLDSTYEPCHDKTNIMGLRPAWVQTSLRIRAVWSGSILFAISFFTCYRVVSERHGSWSDCADMRKLVWIHAGRKPIMLVLSCRGSYGNWFENYLWTWHEVSIIDINLVLGCRLHYWLVPYNYISTGSCSRFD